MEYILKDSSFASSLQTHENTSNPSQNIFLQHIVTVSWSSPVDTQAVLGLMEEFPRLTQKF